MKKKHYDPRESLADKLSTAGIDVQNSFFIALDAGRNLVDKEYLISVSFGAFTLDIFISCT